MMFKKTVSLLFAWSAMCMAVSAETPARLPSDGEYARLQRVVGFEFDAGVPLWDLSAADNDGDAFDIRFNWRGDSCLSVTLPGIRYDFAVNPDTIFRTTRETHFVCLNDTLPMPVCLTADPGSGIAPQNYASRGRAYHSEYMDAFGNVSRTAAGRGTVILPMGDTIPVVILTRHVESQFIASAYHDRPIADPDSIGSLLLRTSVTYSWLAPDLPLPVAQLTEVTDSVGFRAKGPAKRTAWICAPCNQPVRNIANRQAKRRYSPSENGSQYGSTELTDLSVTTDGNGINVRGTSPGDCRISMVLTDVLGRVFASSPEKDCRSGDIVEWQYDNLPPGNYVLYINNGDRSIETQKIVIR